MMSSTRLVAHLHKWKLLLQRVSERKREEEGAEATMKPTGK